MKKICLLPIVWLLVAATANAEAPTGYYTTAEGKSGNALRTALESIIDEHTVISYNNLEEYYPDIDARMDNPDLVWDIYSTCEFSFSDANCSQKKVCDCWNKEHTVPQSWFGKSSPMKSDLFHVLPTDARVNNFRGNLPYGEVSDHSKPVCDDTRALGWRSSNVAFEPADEFKGDIARIYFYMATRYAGKCSGWSGGMFGSEANGFKSSVADMLIKWHRNDPVSEKETRRNDAVFTYQKNRNPFVDFPELAEYIWGNKKGEAWYATATALPTTNIPGLTVYPNPATTGEVTITADDNGLFDYELLDAAGRTLVAGTSTFGGTIHTNGLTNGIYLLKISANDKNRIVKLIINK